MVMNGAQGFRFKGQGIKRTWIDKKDRIRTENPYANRALSAEERKQHGHLQRMKQQFRYDRNNFRTQGTYRHIYDSRGRFVMDRFFRYMEYKQNSKFNIFKYYPFNFPDGWGFLSLIFWTTVFLFSLRGIWYELSDYNFDHNHGANQDTDFRDYTKVICNEVKFSDNLSRIYSFIPWQTISRAWGWVMSCEWFGPGSWLFPWIFMKLSGAKLEEAYVDNIKEYRSVQDFFRRQLKPGLRPIDENSVMTSPSDGKILHFGKICEENDYKISQVKGMDYSLKGVLGPQRKKGKDGSVKKLEVGETSFTDMTNEEYVKKIIRDPVNNDLFYAVVYLAPKDYHRFHSPVNWECTSRRHFPGDLFSVHPKIVNFFNYLYVLNERVVLNGTWEHGFFSFIAVGATNVGTTKIYFDEEVLTNKPYASTKAQLHRGYYFDREYPNPVDLEKGEMIGEFNMGSTVVLIFEAPKGFEFNLEDGQDMKMGEGIVGFCPEKKRIEVPKLVDLTKESKSKVEAETEAKATEEITPIAPKKKRFWLF